MFIVSKDWSASYNLDFIEQIFIVGKEDGVYVAAKGGQQYQAKLGLYSTVARAKAAHEIVMKKIELGRNGVVYMPQDSEIDCVIRGSDDRERHHATGKKTKGHGGS